MQLEAQAGLTSYCNTRLVRNPLEVFPSTCPFVFFGTSGRSGRRIKDFRRAWERVCKEAGLYPVGSFMTFGGRQ